MNIQRPRENIWFLTAIPAGIAAYMYSLWIIIIWFFITMVLYRDQISFKSKTSDSQALVDEAKVTVEAALQAAGGNVEPAEKARMILAEMNDLKQRGNRP